MTKNSDNKVQAKNNATKYLSVKLFKNILQTDQFPPKVINGFRGKQFDLGILYEFLKLKNI